MNRKGYTIPDIIIVAVLVGLVTLFVFGRASYAFSDISEIEENAAETLVVKGATEYGKSIIDTLKKEGNITLSGNDLKQVGYLIDDDNKMSSIKVEVTYNTEKGTVEAKIVK